MMKIWNSDALTQKLRNEMTQLALTATKINGLDSTYEQPIDDDGTTPAD